jgi:hypothetical protein
MSALNRPIMHLLAILRPWNAVILGIAAGIATVLCNAPRQADIVAGFGAAFLIVAYLVTSILHPEDLSPRSCITHGLCIVVTPYAAHCLFYFGTYFGAHHGKVLHVLPCIGFVCTLLGLSILFIHRAIEPKEKPEFCTRCGYNLFGNQSGKCPECGLAIIADRLTT